MRISNIEGEEQEKHGTGEQKGETMSDLIDRQVAIDAIFSAFCYAYCDNCENNNKDDSSCDECHRKYQNWSASRNTIERVINNLPSAEPDLRGKCAGCFYVTGNYGACDFCMRNFPDRYSKG